jgi:hypothetical protein
MDYARYAHLAARATTSATSAHPTTSTTRIPIKVSAPPTATPTADPHHDSGGHFPFWTIVFVVGALALAGAGVVFLLRHLRRAHPGRPPLQALRATVAGLVYRVRNPRARAAGAGFEGISAGPPRQRGAGVPRGSGVVGGREGAAAAGDGDEAWDSRVLDERFYEEEDTELRPAPGSTEYRGARGAHTAGMPSENPFGDDHAVGLRSVSPRPDGAAHRPEGEVGAAPRQFV